MPGGYCRRPLTRKTMESGQPCEHRSRGTTGFAAVPGQTAPSEGWSASAPAARLLQWNTKTLEEWNKRFNRAMLTKPWIIAKLAPKVMNRHFRDKIRSYRYGAQGKAFEDRVFEHTRMVLEKYTTDSLG